jgi:ubiquinone/menaquinone biosynthesis C-methylase UbiE
MSETMRFVEPAIVTTQFHIREGDTVADLGAGRGYFLEPLVNAVGAEGLVYALEIQKNLVETMGEQVRSAGMDNARVIWADLEEPNGTTLENDTLDVAIMVNTLFQLDDKAAGAHEVFRALRSGGKYFVVDWSESFNNLGPEPGAVLAEADARAIVESAGFVFERSFPAGAHHYGVAFRKP